jgi:DNA-binding response OmpR family regulator
MSNAHILIVEDDPQWQSSITGILQSVAAHITHTAQLEEACHWLKTRHFNIAIVDMSLYPGDPQNSDGLTFLQEVRKQQLEESLSVIILSAYGDMKRMRIAFHEHRVVDFLDKSALGNGDLLVNTVKKALQDRHLDRPLKIEIEGGGELDRLWRNLNWARRESRTQLRAEMYDLLCRLFPRAERLFIQPLPAGQSGAGVLQVEGSNRTETLASVVVKFGKREKIEQEHRHYEQYVKGQSSFATTQLNAVSGRCMGALTYSLIGADWGRVYNFGDFFIRSNADSICLVLEKLFRTTCGRWYDSHDGPRRKQNLVELYSDGFHIPWDEVWQGAAATGINLAADYLHFPDLAGAFVNPIHWQTEPNGALRPIYVSTCQVVTHGDLNAFNVLITEDGNCWLIDFYRTGWGHILRDVVELETVIKFSLTNIEQLSDHRQFEQLLLSQTRIDQPVVLPDHHPQLKALRTISFLRSNIAAPLTGIHNTNMVEYNVSLLLATLNLLRLDFLRTQHTRVLLSAALLCQWLQDNWHPTGITQFNLPSIQSR